MLGLLEPRCSHVANAGNNLAMGKAKTNNREGFPVDAKPPDSVKD